MDGLPEGSRPWFVRVSLPGSYKIAPYAVGGWIVTAIYVIGTLASTAILVLGIDDEGPSTRRIVFWAIGFGFWTALFLIVAIKTSVAAKVTIEPRSRTRRGTRK